MEWMILPFKRYFEFTGRSRRTEFWMFVLLSVLVSTAIFVLIFMTGGAGAMLNADGSADGAALGWLMGGWGILLLLWGLFTIIPSISVSVRRLHDRDMSGWWYLGFVIASFIPLLGIVASIAYIVVMALPGTPGPNRFGPDPKGAGEGEVFN